MTYTWSYESFIIQCVHVYIVFSLHSNSIINQSHHTIQSLTIAGNWLITEKCKENRLQIQCQNYQKFNHSTRNCFAQSVCQICAKQHKTSQHSCNICEIHDQICSHSILKCSNCEEDHMTNDNTCVFKTNSEKRSYKYA